MHISVYLLYKIYIAYRYQTYTSFWDGDQMDSTCIKWKSLESAARTTFSGPCYQATPSKLDRACSNTDCL